jgi:putative ATPase
MSERDLFGDAGDGLQAVPGREEAPLAERMRPRCLEAFVGQEHLLGPGRPLRRLIEEGRIPSMILWGPPGSGKTTLARLLAHHTGAAFETFSAVLSGVREVRAVVERARLRRQRGEAATLLFVDEIHRFNRAQQDAFLPHVETGRIVLVGSTTENPSFEVNAALLSRTTVFLLEPLSEQHLHLLLERALADAEQGLAPAPDRPLAIEPSAAGVLIGLADGDARVLYNLLEMAADAARAAGSERIEATLLHRLLSRRTLRHDRQGEAHYNLISVLHKAVRGSDADAALYWLARILEGGEDPLFVARRLVRMAAEDIGLADPRALRIALDARDAYHFLGSPEGEIALFEAVAYLALAAKSNALYRAEGAARRMVRDHPSLPVPLHLRNAPTGLMKELGYGAGYRYDPDWPGGLAPQTYLPAELEGEVLYRPTERGLEARLAERQQWLRRRRAELIAQQASPQQPPEPAADKPEPEEGKAP